MAKFGMQMPTARAGKGISPNVYTALMVVACVFLAAACFVMFRAAASVGKDGSPFGLYADGDPIQLPNK